MTTTTDDPAVEAAARVIAETSCFDVDECIGSDDCGCSHLARAALLAAERAAWRGIETAPRDGTPILVAIAGDEFRPMLVQSPRAKSRWHVVGSESRVLTKEPTHWRPLPAPPDGGGDV